VSVGLCVGVSGCVGGFVCWCEWVGGCVGGFVCWCEWVGGCVGGFMCRWMGQCWSTHAFSHVRGAQSRDDERH